MSLSRVKPGSLLPSNSLMDPISGHEKQHWIAHLMSLQAPHQVVEMWVLLSFVVHCPILLARLNRGVR